MDGAVVSGEAAVVVDSDGAAPVSIGAGSTGGLGSGTG
jgi:hypothetical protein